MSRSWCGKGMIVALLGPDGSGKTTVAELLMRRMEGRPFTACRYLRRTFRLLPRRRELRAKVLAALGVSSGTPMMKPELDPNAMLPPAALGRLLYHPVYHAIDMFLARGALRKMCGRGELVLFDRFYFDSYFQRRFMNVPWRLLDWCSALVPRPDLVVCLHGDPAELHARKPELTVEEIVRQQAAIRRLVVGRSFPWVTVETGGGVESAVRQVECAIRAHVRC